MDKIKFKAKPFGSWREGELYGGCLQLHTDTTYIVVGSGGGSKKFFRVKPESLRQFACVDMNGVDVYSGSIVKTTDGKNYQIRVAPFLITCGKIIPLDCPLGKDILFELVEDDYENY